MAVTDKKSSGQKKTKKVRKSIPQGKVYINCTANNTLVTITDSLGNALAQSSAGSVGFRGTRKSTPYAAQVAAETAMKLASPYGLQKVEIMIRGFGVGRDQSLRGIASSGVEILSLHDTTAVAHGGVRKKKARRV